MLLDKVIEVLRGSNKPRKSSYKQPVIFVHVFSENDCTVQVGSRVVLQGVSRTRANEEVKARVERFKARGLPHTVEVFTSKEK